MQKPVLLVWIANGGKASSAHSGFKVHFEATEIGKKSRWADSKDNAHLIIDFNGGVEAYPYQFSKLLVSVGTPAQSPLLTEEWSAGVPSTATNADIVSAIEGLVMRVRDTLRLVYSMRALASLYSTDQRNEIISRPGLTKLCDQIWQGGGQKAWDINSITRNIVLVADDKLPKERSNKLPWGVTTVGALNITVKSVERAPSLTPGVGESTLYLINGRGNTQVVVSCEFRKGTWIGAVLYLRNTSGKSWQDQISDALKEIEQKCRELTFPDHVFSDITGSTASGKMEELVKGGRVESKLLVERTRS